MRRLWLLGAVCWCACDDGGKSGGLAGEDVSPEDLYGFWSHTGEESTTLLAFQAQDEYWNELAGRTDVYFIYTQNSSDYNQLLQVGVFRLEEGHLVTESLFDGNGLPLNTTANELRGLVPGERLVLESKNEASGERTYVRHERCPRPTLPTGYVLTSAGRPMATGGGSLALAGGFVFAQDADGSGFYVSSQPGVALGDAANQSGFDVFGSNRGACEWRDFPSPAGGSGDAVWRDGVFHVVSRDRQGVLRLWRTTPPAIADRRPVWSALDIARFDGTAAFELELDAAGRAVVAVSGGGTTRVFREADGRISEVDAGATSPPDGPMLDMQLDGEEVRVLASARDLPRTDVWVLGRDGWRTEASLEVWALLGAFGPDGVAHVAGVGGAPREVVYVALRDGRASPSVTLGVGPPLAMDVSPEGDVAIAMDGSREGMQATVLWRLRGGAWTREVPIIQPSGALGSIRGVQNWQIPRMLLGPGGRMLLGAQGDTVLERLPDAEHAPETARVTLNIDPALGVQVRSETLGLRCPGDCTAEAPVGSFFDLALTGEGVSLDVWRPFDCLEGRCAWVVRPGTNTFELMGEPPPPVTERVVVGAAGVTVEVHDGVLDGRGYLGTLRYAGAALTLGDVSLGERAPGDPGSVVAAFTPDGPVRFVTELGGGVEQARLAVAGDGIVLAATFSGAAPLRPEIAAAGGSDVLLAALDAGGRRRATRWLGSPGNEHVHDLTGDGAGGTLALLLLGGPVDLGGGVVEVTRPSLAVARFDASLAARWVRALPFTDDSGPGIELGRAGDVVSLVVRDDGGALDLGDGVRPPGVTLATFALDDGRLLAAHHVNGFAAPRLLALDGGPLVAGGAGGGVFLDGGPAQLSRPLGFVRLTGQGLVLTSMDPSPLDAVVGLHGIAPAGPDVFVVGPTRFGQTTGLRIAPDGQILANTTLAQPLPGLMTPTMKCRVRTNEHGTLLSCTAGGPHDIGGPSPLIGRSDAVFTRYRPL